MKIYYETAGWRHAITPCPYGIKLKQTERVILMGTDDCAKCKNCNEYDGREEWVDCDFIKEESK